MVEVDLHIHTTGSSDGQHTPEEILALAQEIGLKALAFSDHNSVASIAYGLESAPKYQVEFVPALELDTFYQDEDVHILAYYVNHRDPRLISWLDEIEKKKRRQAQERIAKLQGLGFIFEEADLKKISGDLFPTGATFLKAILSRSENKDDPRLKPYLEGSRSESPYVNFYLDYLRGGRPAAAPMVGLDTPEVIARVRSLGAVPVLAHPQNLKEEALSRFGNAGLQGIEVFCSYHGAAEEKRYRELAQRYGLVMTAGSDFHGVKIKPNVRLGGISFSEYGMVARLKKLAGWD